MLVVRLLIILNLKVYMKEKQINELSPEEIGQILYLSNQSTGRRRLITNLFGISDEVLNTILIKYSNSTIYKRVEADYS